MLQLKEPKDLIPMKNTVINIVNMYFVKLYVLKSFPSGIWQYENL